MAGGGGGCGRAILSLSLSSSSSSSFISRSIFSFSRSAFPLRSQHTRVYPGFCRTLCFSTADVANETEGSINPLRHSLLLERLRSRHLKEASKGGSQKQMMPAAAPHQTAAAQKRKKEEGKTVIVASSFEELGLGEEVMGALRETGISVPTEIQSIGVPAVLRGENVVLGSHTGSGKTLAYMLPLVQLLRHDEELFGMLIKPRRPRAVVLCPTRELTEQVFRVAKSISHHARFRSTMISGGGRSRPQEDSLNVPIDMVVGTPGRILQHIDDGNMVYGDIKYLVLDEADTMFDKGFGPDIRRFLGPLKNRATRPGDQGFQIVLVAATMTKAVQKLIDEEFQGIIHLRTSTLHKKVASARHDFIKLSGAENKLESLLQVLEPSLAKGNRVMVFCNTLNSSRAVDHFLTENQIYTVNYHGEVPAEERVENLRKFRSDEGDCPTLVCTDLAARGLDLDVDHVIMFDFPSNSIDYLHRTGRTARMGAKGKVTSLIAKKDVLLAEHIEDAIRKNESLESLNQGSVRRDVKASHVGQRGRNSNTTRKNKTSSSNSSVIGRRAALALSQKLSVSKSARKPVSGGKLTSGKSKKTLAPSNPPTSVNKKLSVSKSAGNSASGGKPASRKYKKTLSPLKPPSSPKGAKASVNKKFGAARSAASKLSVVGFRGRSSSGKKEALKG